nr:immunoglobulin light chain junction region [Macaca mulatta]MOV62407.1 immunoglobulin light chain junction region [Macaca mulatta]MOV62821.1 immunoglobulin light chain junction region [Macaca mulatta]
CVQGIAFPFTF